MDENELLGADPEEGTGTETEIIIDTSEFAAEISVLEEKFEVLTEQVTLATDKITGCYCLLLILAVLGLRNALRSIIRKVMNLRGGTDDV